MHVSRTWSWLQLVLIGTLLPGGGTTGLAQIGAVAGVRGVAPGSIPDVIAGRVINAVTNAPLPRALVQIGGHAVLTDSEGRFRFEQPGAPTGSIAVRKPGFSVSPEQMEGSGFGDAVNGSEDPSALTLTLWPEGLLTGTVLAPNGEPIEHITVMARRSLFDEQGHHRQISGQAQTDSHGQFRIPAPAGEYSLETQFSQRTPGRDEAVLPQTYPADSSGKGGAVHLASGQQQTIEIRVKLSRTQAVTLPFDSSDEGMPRVTAQSSDGQTFTTGIARSQQPGSMQLNLPQGSYTLHATRFTRDGMQFGQSSVTVEDHDVTAPPLHLASLPSIPIAVVEDAGARQAVAQPGNRPGSSAVPNLMQFNLVLEPAETDPSSPFQFGVRPSQQRDSSFAIAAPPGVYHLNAGVASGWYIRSATAGGTDLLHEDLVVSAGSSPSPITLIASNQTGTLEGVVRLTGAPASCWLYLIASGPALPAVLVRRSDSTGGYRLTDLPPGSYRAVAFPYRHSENLQDPDVLSRFGAHVGSVTVAAGATETLDLDAVTAKELAR